MRGLSPLAELAYRADKLADAVVLGDGLADGGVGGVNAVDVVQRGEDVVFALELVEVKPVRVRLHGDFHVFEEELLLVLAQSLEKLHILHGAVHHRAAVRRDEAVGKIVAALYRALKQRAAVLAQKARHVIRRHLHRARARRAQSRRERARQVQKRLGGVLADIRHAHLSLALRLKDELILRLLQEVFKIEQML